MPKAKRNEYSNELFMESEAGCDVLNAKTNHLSKSAIQQKSGVSRWSTQKRVGITLVAVAVFIIGISSLIIAAKALKIHHSVLHGVTKTDKKLEVQQRAEGKVLSDITRSLNNISRKVEKSADRVRKQSSDDEVTFASLNQHLDSLWKDVEQSDREIKRRVSNVVQSNKQRMMAIVREQSLVSRNIKNLINGVNTKTQLIHDKVDTMQTHNRRHNATLHELSATASKHHEILKIMSGQIDKLVAAQTEQTTQAARTDPIDLDYVTYDDDLDLSNDTNSTMTTPVPTSPPQQGCKRGWKEFGGRCYFFHDCPSYNKCSANSAAAACQNLGAVLTPVRSRRLALFLQRSLESLPLENIFIGGRRRNSGVWQWPGGGTISYHTYTQWYDPPSNNPRGYGCMVMDDGLYWHPFACSSTYEYSYVCEKEM